VDLIKKLSVSADVISTVEFNQTGEFLATGDKGGRVVIFQREPQVRDISDKHTFPFLTNFETNWNWKLRWEILKHKLHF